MSLTKIARPFLKHRMVAFDRYDTQAESIQRAVLAKLVRQAADTEWGNSHAYDSIKNYENFAKHVPVNTYEDLKGFIDRMRHGEKDILWPGRVRWYAKSSGTTNDKSKFIPVSKQGLDKIHYYGGEDTVIGYMRNYPGSRIMDGRTLILGGSHAPNYNTPGTLVGDLSAILIENITPFINILRIPSKKVALLSDFEEKRNRIAEAAIGKNVTNISGVPSWMMSLLTRVLEISGKDSIDQVWPNLEVFFHGGVAFTPYREQYKRMIRSDKMHYMETYNASEGFFGIQLDPNDTAMTLMIDYDVFYEFIPMEELDSECPTALPLWEVEPGKNYAMVISTSCGLWRYMIGDTVRFTQKNPYKFHISGRTKSFINAFGEELIVDNAEKGLERACSETGASVREYTAAPVYMDENGRCNHQWVIEFEKKPASVEAFAKILDTALQNINSDYEAKRYKDLTLQPLQIVVARENLFHDWLKSKGKLGGQHKVPRLNNKRDIIEEILALNTPTSAK